MRDKGARSRLQRLEQVKGLLKARDHLTAAQLASELDVSLRTIRRDLELLRDEGVPVESDRGRGGGLRLHRSWSLGRLHLGPEEAIDLLLSIAIAERMESPVLLRHLAPIKRKIVAAFSNAYQSKIRSLRERILVGKPASARIAASVSSAPPRAQPGISDAFFNMRCLAIDYVDQSGRVTSREVEPQFLYLSVPVWYLLTWDRLRGDIRYFRVDRISRAERIEAGFKLADPTAYLAVAERGIARL
jgi:predicted DNA-binding transcriptional regulator YafY